MHAWRYIALGDSTTSGEGLGYGMVFNSSWTPLPKVDAAFEPDSLQQGLDLEGTTGQDILKWLSPCDFEARPDFNKMPTKYKVLNALLETPAVQLGLCHAATFWSAPANDLGIWAPGGEACHRSALSYPFILRAQLKAGSHFSSQSCSGASIPNGVVAKQVGPKPESSAPVGPQFGNYTLGDINVEFDRLNPNLVTLGIGANDAGWAGALQYCIVSTTAKAIAGALSGTAAAVFTDFASLAMGLLFGPEASTSWQDGDCTLANPGPVAGSSLAALEGLDESIAEVVDWIYLHKAAASQRQRRLGAPAEQVEAAGLTVLVQTYYAALPHGDQAPAFADCPDVLMFSKANLDLFNEFEDRLNAQIRAAIVLANSANSQRDVRELNLEAVFSGHELCSADPWAYGPSILLKSLFHGTFKDTSGPGLGLINAVAHPTLEAHAVFAAAAAQLVSTA